MPGAPVIALPLDASLGSMVLACGVLFAVAAIAGALAGLMGSDFEDTGSTPPRPRPRVHDQEVMSDRNDADNSCCQRQGRCAHAPGLSNKQVDPVSAGTPTGPRREKPC